MKRNSILVLFVTGLLLLSACVGGNGPAQSDVVPDAGDQQAAAATPTHTPEAGDDTSEEPDGMQDEGQAAEPLATPTVKPGLEATDPDSVNLASGEPTLLEFFAFW